MKSKLFLIVLMSFFFVSFVSSAFFYSEEHEKPMGTLCTTCSSLGGEQIFVINPTGVVINGFNQSAGSQFTHCYIQYLNESTIVAGTFSGDYCAVTATQLDYGKFYWIKANATSAGDSYYNNSVTYNITGSYLLWTSSKATSDSSVQATHLWVVKSLNLTIISSTINLNSPDDSLKVYKSEYTNKTFNITFIAPTGEKINNVSFLSNLTGTWNRTETIDFSSQNLSSVTVIFNYTVPYTSASYKWGAEIFTNVTGIGYSTTNRTLQTGVPISIAYCNSTQNITYLNFTAIDESTNANLNFSIVSLSLNYFLENSSAFSSYSYINSTENEEFTFCASPSNKDYKTNYSIYYKQGTAYPQRVSEKALFNLNSTVTNDTLYLLSSTSGIYVTFQITNTADQLLSGVTVNATRVVGGSTTVVASGVTSAAGTVTFWLNPDAYHTFTFSKVGYNTYTYSDYPTQSSYTVSLSGGTTSIAYDFTQGMKLFLYPEDEELFNNTVYNFAFNLTSSYWEITDFGFNLRLSNGTILTSYTSTTEGTAANVNYNTTNQTIIYIDYYWNIMGNYTNGTSYWIVSDTTNTQWSIKTFFTDLDTYLDSGLFGLDDFGRMFIIFLILFISVGIMSYKYGMTSPLSITFLVFSVIFFFDIVVGLIPSIRGIDHLLTYISGISLITVIIGEVSR